MDKRKKTFIVSDAHLGFDEVSKEIEKLERLIEFFEHVRENGDFLVILGDLFDFWFEYRYMIDAAHFPVLASLWQIRKKGLRIDYYLGNHDYWTNGFFLRNLVTHVHKSPTCEMFGNKKVLLAHGDGLSKDEKGYLFIKRILRNRVSHLLFRFLHPDIGAWLARQTSRKSRNQSEYRRERAAKRLREFAKEKLEAGEYDWIIAGHSHHPEKTVFGEGTYLNIGDWSDNYTYGLVDGEDLHLKKWNVRSSGGSSSG